MNKINCVEMKHKGAEKINEKVKNLSIEDELTFWQEHSKALKKHRENLIKKRK